MMMMIPDWVWFDCSLARAEKINLGVNKMLVFLETEMAWYVYAPIQLYDL